MYVYKKHWWPYSSLLLLYQKIHCLMRAFQRSRQKHSVLQNDISVQKKQYMHSEKLFVFDARVLKRASAFCAFQSIAQRSCDPATAPYVIAFPKGWRYSMGPQTREGGCSMGPCVQNAARGLHPPKNPENIKNVWKKIKDNIKKNWFTKSDYIDVKNKFKQFKTY